MYNLLKDLIKVLAIATDDPLLMKADEARLIAVLDAATREGVVHQAELNSVATAYTQAQAAGERGHADLEPVAAAPADSEETVSDAAVEGVGGGGDDADDDDGNSGNSGPANGAVPFHGRKMMRTNSRGRS